MESKSAQQHPASGQVIDSQGLSMVFPATVYLGCAGICVFNRPAFRHNKTEQLIAGLDTFPVHAAGWFVTSCDDLLHAGNPI